MNYTIEILKAMIVLSGSQILSAEADKDRLTLKRAIYLPLSRDARFSLSAFFDIPHDSVFGDSRKILDDRL